MKAGTLSVGLAFLWLAMGEDQLVPGTHLISSAIAGLNERITTAGILMESRAKKSVLLSAGVAGGCASCGGARSSATYSKLLKSRDILAGCIVQVKVDGKVVSTAASGPAILQKFKDEFTSAECCRTEVQRRQFPGHPLAARMESLVDRLEPLPVNVGIHLGGGEVGVT